MSISTSPPTFFTPSQSRFPSNFPLDNWNFIELYSSGRQHWPIRTHHNQPARYQSEKSPVPEESKSASLDESDETVSQPTIDKRISGSSARARPHWILGHYHTPSDSIIVYQAYNSTIADYALKHGRFLGCTVFLPTRMTWIKCNFLWMQYRAGWSFKDSNQQRILAIFLKRSAWEQYLYFAQQSSAEDTDDTAVDESERKSDFKLDGLVRVQWDPDHHPSGGNVIGRRAVQLGLKNVQSFISGQDWNGIADVTEFVRSQYQNVQANRLDLLWVPIERIYEPAIDFIRVKHRLEPVPSQPQAAASASKGSSVGVNGLFH